MSESIAVGICQCGCGENTAYSNGKYGTYRRGHQRYKYGKRPTDGKDVNPSGICLCGCGEETEISTFSCRQKGCVEGLPVRFAKGHYWRWYRNQQYTYKEEDRGYKTPCWIWQGSVNGVGYGKMSVDGERTYAHRVYYERHKGIIPQGYDIDHLCRVHPCVNPDHLEAVTHKQNVYRGKRTKLTYEQAVKIRRLRATTKVSYGELAESFGVSRWTVREIVAGTRWTSPD